MQKIPKGIRIYAIIFILIGLYGFGSIVSKIFFSQVTDWNKGISVYGPLFYLAQIIIGANLIRLKNWARIIAILLYLLGIIIFVLMFFTTPIKTNILSVLMWPVFCLSFILFYISGIFYFSKKEIKQKFSNS